MAHLLTPSLGLVCLEPIRARMQRPAVGVNLPAPRSQYPRPLGSERRENMSSSAPRPRALVTGASSGLGAAYAEQLAYRGYDLVLVARRRERLATLVERLGREIGIEAEAVAA